MCKADWDEHVCRMGELNRKRELNAAAELKRAEIILARRYTHQAMLAKFLRTAAQPQLLWTPAKHCADTILLEEQRQLELAVWMVRIHQVSQWYVNHTARSGMSGTCLFRGPAETVPSSWAFCARACMVGSCHLDSGVPRQATCMLAEEGHVCGLNLTGRLRMMTLL